MENQNKQSILKVNHLLIMNAQMKVQNQKKLLQVLAKKEKIQKANYMRQYRANKMTAEEKSIG